jgi:hypothetical protein
MGSVFIGLLALLAALLAGCEVVPYQQAPLPQPRPVPPPAPVVIYQPAPPPPVPNYAYEEIRRCRADNQRAHAELLDSYERARQAGRIDPAEAQRFYAMDAQLRSWRAQLGRDGMTLQECQFISGEIARTRGEVARMSRYDPVLARCIADNRQMHQDTLAIYENARLAGRIDPYEAQRFSVMEERLRLMSTDVSRGGLSLPDCQRIGGAIVQEREEVQRMARYESPIPACMADNRRAHEAVYSVYNDGLRTGHIAPYEAQRFSEVDQRLRNYLMDMRRDGVTLEECQRMGFAIARERNMVERMIRR